MKVISKFIFIFLISSLLFIIFSIILWTPATNKIMRHKSLQAANISNNSLRRNNATENKLAIDSGRKNGKSIIKEDKSTSKKNDYFNYDNVKSYDPNKAISYSNTKSNVSGILKIPSVDIKLPIYKGLSDKNLSLGVGTMRKTEIMGKGNYVLGGHHISDPKALLSPLNKVRLGNTISLTDGSHIYYYKIYSKKTISQNDIDILKNTKKSIVTLITCATEKYGESERIYVRGYLLRTRNSTD